jgi:post-segregation antitoxin (ccd killing protein)
MARVNVYLPDELADAARSAGLNVSSLTQDALRRALAGRRTAEWLRSLDGLPTTEVRHEDAMAALHDARDEMGTSGG